MQIPDKFFFQDTIFDIYDCYPIDHFFISNPDKRPNPPSTGLWRGYIASFEIKDSMLFIKDIETMDYDENNLGKRILTSIRNDIFLDEDSLKVNNFNGLIILTKDFMVTGFNKNSKEGTLNFILQFENGRLTKQFEFINLEFDVIKKRQLTAFKKTAEYKKIKNELIEDKKYSRKSAENFISWRIFEITKKILF